MSCNFELITELKSALGATSSSSVARAASVFNSGGACREQMAGLVQRVFLSRNGAAPRQVVFCGINTEVGCSSVCAQVGRVLAAHSAREVCLVDANLCSQRLAGILGIDATPISAERSKPVRERCVQVNDKLWLAGAGLLAGDSETLPPVAELKERLARLASAFEYVLIDSPGANVSGDAAVLGCAADAAILVIEANVTRRVTARKAKEVLDAANVRLLGTVLYNRTFPIPEQLYGRL